MAADERTSEAEKLIAAAEKLLLEDGDPQEAAASAAQALDLLQEAFVFADRRESDYLRTLVKAHIRAKDFDSALKAAKEGLERFQDAQDKRGEGAAFELLSLALSEKGLLGKAIRNAQKAAFAFEDAGDDRGRAGAIRAVSRLQCRLGHFERALRTVQDALNIFEELDDLPEQASTLQLRAEVFMGKSELKSAARCAQEARELFQDAKDAKGEAAALLQLAAAELAEGDAGKAARTAEEAQAIASEAGDAAGEAAAHRVLCDTHMRAGQYDSALKAGQKALSLYRDLGDRKAEECATLMHNCTAQLQSVLQKEKTGKGTEKSFRDGSEKALKFAKEALAIAKKMGDDQFTGSALYTVAQCHTLAGKAPEAMKVAEEGLRHLRQCGDLRGEGAMLVLLANVHFLLFRDFQRAREAAEEGVWLLQQAGDAAGEEQGWQTLERIEEEQKELQKQQQMLAQAAAAQGAQSWPPPQFAQQAVEPQDAGAAMPSMARSGYDPKLAKLDMGSGLSVEAVHKQIAEVAKGLIGIDEEIELDMPLMEAGLTSNTAVLLRDALMQQLPGVNLPVTLTFDYPSIASMGELVLENAAKAALKNK